MSQMMYKHIMAGFVKSNMINLMINHKNQLL